MQYIIHNNKQTFKYEQINGLCERYLICSEWKIIQLGYNGHTKYKSNKHEQTMKHTNNVGLMIPTLRTKKRKNN